VTGPDGFFVPDQVLGHGAMAPRRRLGTRHPGHAAQRDWNYAAFSATGERSTTVNQAECLACHAGQGELHVHAGQMRVAARK